MAEPEPEPERMGGTGTRYYSIDFEVWLAARANASRASLAAARDAFSDAATARSASVHDRRHSAKHADSLGRVSRPPTPRPTH